MSPVGAVCDATPSVWSVTAVVVQHPVWLLMGWSVLGGVEKSTELSWTGGGCR